MEYFVLVAFWLVTMLWPYALRRTTHRRAKSLSFHIGQSEATILFAKIVITLATGSMAGWYFGWYVVEHDAHVILTVLVSVMIISCLLVAYIPLQERTRRGRVHNFISYVGFAAIMPFILLFLAGSAHSIYTEYALMGIVVAMVLLVALTRSRTIASNYFMSMQAVYIFLFGCGLVIATYIG